MSTFVYIMTNPNHTVLYTGVTNNLARRVAEHCSGEGSTFTRRYQVKKLVFCEQFDKSIDAIAAEKRIKAVEFKVCGPFSVEKNMVVAMDV